jgi:hypothetical protein
LSDDFQTSSLLPALPILVLLSIGSCGLEDESKLTVDCELVNASGAMSPFRSTLSPAMGRYVMSSISAEKESYGIESGWHLGKPETSQLFSETSLRNGRNVPCDTSCRATQVQHASAVVAPGKSRHLYHHRLEVVISV